jgi:hypothetical protein
MRDVQHLQGGLQILRRQHPLTHPRQPTIDPRPHRLVDLQMQVRGTILTRPIQQAKDVQHGG